MEQKNVTNRTAKKLKSLLQDLVFIELKTDEVNGIAWQKEIPMPVYMHALADQIKSDEIETIPSDAIIRGLVTILGADPEFKYNSQYKQFLDALEIDIIKEIILTGIEFAEEKSFVDALVYFNAALVIDENQVDAIFNMGRTYQEMYGESEDQSLRPFIKYYLERTIELAPEFGLAYYALGLFYYNEGKYEEAETEWLHALQYSLSQEVKEEIVVSLSKVRDRATFERGKTHILSGRTDEGLELLKSIEEEHDDWWELNFFIGLGLRLQEAYEDALPYFLKTLSLNTGAVHAMNELGVCFIALGDYEQALKYYKEALRLSPQNAEFICNKGIVYFHMKDYEGAYDLIEHAHDLSPEDEVIQMWYQHIKQFVS